METLPGRLRTTGMTEMDLVAWIELSSIQTIGMIMYIVNFEAIIIKNYKSYALRP